MTSSLKQVLFVESGFGCDQHGQNATVRLPLQSLFTYCLALAAAPRVPLANFRKLVFELAGMPSNSTAFPALKGLCLEDAMG